MTGSGLSDMAPPQARASICTRYGSPLGQAAAIINNTIEDTQMNTRPTMSKVAPTMLEDTPREANSLVVSPVQQAEELLEQIEPAPPPVGSSIAKIATAIANVMARVGVVGKDGENKFHNYKYAKMEDVLRRVTPLIAAEGLVIVQTEIGRAMFDGDRAIAVKYAFTICHSSGEVWPERPVQTGLSRCRDSKGGFDDKCLNKCHTAARKYFILALFQVPTGVDEDADMDADLKNGKSIYDPREDYVGGIPERDTKQPETKKYSRAADAAATHIANAAAMRRELENCDTIAELDKTAVEMEGRQSYKNLWQELMDSIAKSYAATLARLQQEAVADQVVHDVDGEEPRKATVDDFGLEPVEPSSSSISHGDPGYETFSEPQWLGDLGRALEKCADLDELARIKNEILLPAKGKASAKTYQKGCGWYHQKLDAIGKP